MEITLIDISLFHCFNFRSSQTSGIDPFWEGKLINVPGYSGPIEVKRMVPRSLQQDYENDVLPRLGPEWKKLGFGSRV